MRRLSLLLLALALLPAHGAPEEWSRPFAGHRVIGNLYSVGTYDLSSFLVTSTEGHILINTGLADSTPLIRANIERLGFRFNDIRILLNMQAHDDHVGALAEIKRLTGAKVWVTAGDAPVLEDGGRSDFHFGPGEKFPPVEVDRVLRDGELIEIGDAQLVVRLTPGHTRGSVSYTMKIAEVGREYDVVIANMGSINPGVKLLDNTNYPEIADDYAQTFTRQQALPCDVWVAAHASQYGMHRKFTKGDPYSPETFVDPQGYLAAVKRHEDVFRRQLAEERAAKEPAP